MSGLVHAVLREQIRRTIQKLTATDVRSIYVERLLHRLCRFIQHCGTRNEIDRRPIATSLTLRRNASAQEHN
ncbi:hypothetical protein C5E08_15510 [Rathayibacter iranicus]|uniref:Uncharacterized protein n=1 Tax=Rathayibacter iranicus TaxID=59737 RepID=A0AAD1ENH1_9MICO|nr:hypothetical protein C7V51_15760 [Rathayibacter iranicus]PPI41405.1 hypothetical protein C5E09_14620 [Rathayibacter iranicus]PPI57433.1 hypothetical protein C5E08_15510 [Rathayibacter iranicus]PPI68300.1 hypothetical protein C5E01_14565 [Rathayibacter iranicus]